MNTIRRLSISFSLVFLLAANSINISGMSRFRPLAMTITRRASHTKPAPTKTVRFFNATNGKIAIRDKKHYHDYPPVSGGILSLDLGSQNDTLQVSFKAKTYFVKINETTSAICMSAEGRPMFTDQLGEQLEASCHKTDVEAGTDSQVPCLRKITIIDTTDPEYEVYVAGFRDESSFLDPFSNEVLLKKNHLDRINIRHQPYLVFRIYNTSFYYIAITETTNTIHIKFENGIPFPVFFDQDNNELEHSLQI